MLSGRKILVTGPAGQIARPLCEFLAKDNEVWGIARFSQPGSREEVEAMGVRTLAIDLADPDFSDLPDDFDHVLHLAAAIVGVDDYDWALRVNAEATGLLLTHCRNARSALVMSTSSTYKPHEDPAHAFVETDPLGDPVVPGSPTYAISKIAEEAVARYCARAFDLPVTIARMNVAYSSFGGVPAYHLDALVNGDTINVRHPMLRYSPIHQDDINGQVEAMLEAASVPATIVNWGGDDALGPRDWLPLFEELTGRTAQVTHNPLPGSQIGNILDNAKRLAITGPCTVRFPDGMRRLYETRYPNGPDGPSAGMANPLA
jgi:nucleoside-diphosphate-sugar epimerase